MCIDLKIIRIQAWIHHAKLASGDARPPLILRARACSARARFLAVRFSHYPVCRSYTFIEKKRYGLVSMQVEKLVQSTSRPKRLNRRSKCYTKYNQVELCKYEHFNEICNIQTVLLLLLLLL